MKIALTHAEAVEAIRRHYNFPPPAEIVIGENKPAYKAPEVINLANVPPFLKGTSDNNGSYAWTFISDNVRHDKIAAIRELRSLTGMWLKECKDAVENWTEYATLVHRKNDWPRPEYTKFV